MQKPLLLLLILVWLTPAPSVLAQPMLAQPIGMGRVDSLYKLYTRFSGIRQAELAIQLATATQESDLPKARYYAQTGLTWFEHHPNDELPLGAVADLANAYWLLEQFRCVDSVYRAGIDRARNKGESDQLIRLLASFGLFQLEQGNRLEAIPLLREALTLAEGDAYAATRSLTLNNLGVAYDKLGEYGQALTHYHQALREADSQHDRRAMGLAEANIAGIFSQLGNPERAVKMLDRAAAQFAATHDGALTNQCRLQIAGNYLQMNRPDLARPLVGWGMNESRRAHWQTQLLMAHVLMARLNLADHKAGEAEWYARAALSMARRANVGMAAQPLMYLAKATSALGHSTEAVQLARSAVNATWQTNNKNERREANNILADVLEAAGRPTEALTVRKTNQALSDSLYTTSFRDQFSYLQVTSETEKKEQRIAFLDRENGLRERQLRWLVAGMVVLAGLLAVVLILYRIKQRDARRIQRHKEKIEQQSAQLTLLMRELHHRVKNNLQIVSSLLSLQSGRLTDVQARVAVREGQRRVEAMSMLHQRLYTTADVTTINFSIYVTDLLENLMATYGYQAADCDLTLAVTQQRLDTDTAIPLGLIINELITNSFKYAYGDVTRPALTVRLETGDGLYGDSSVGSYLRLTVQDNGPGLPAAPPLHPYADKLVVEAGTLVVDTVIRPAALPKTFGMQLVHSLARQLRATCQFQSENGLRFQLEMPFHTA